MFTTRWRPGHANGLNLCLGGTSPPKRKRNSAQRSVWSLDAAEKSNALHGGFRAVGAWVSSSFLFPFRRNINSHWI